MEVITLVGDGEGVAVFVGVGVKVAGASVGATAVSVCATAVCSSGLRVRSGVVPHAAANKTIKDIATKRIFELFFIIFPFLKAILPQRKYADALQIKKQILLP